MGIKEMLNEIRKLRMNLSGIDSITLAGSIARVQLFNEIRMLEDEVVRAVQAACRDHLKGLDHEIQVAQNATLKVVVPHDIEPPVIVALATALKQKGVYGWQFSLQVL